MENINDDITWNNTIEFTYPITSGYVIKVYDGDTITSASKMPYENSSLFRFSVRLNGIDTPEIKSKNKNEKALAILARDSLSQLIMNKNVTLQNVKNEKFCFYCSKVISRLENLIWKPISDKEYLDSSYKQ